MYNFKTIYELLNEFSKKDINMAIKKLTVEEQEIIRIKYGDNLNKCVKTNNITAEQAEKFHRCIVPKIKRIIIASSRKPKSIYEYFKDHTKEEVDEAIDHLSDDHKKLLNQICSANLATRRASITYTSDDIYKFHDQVLPRIGRYLELGPTARKIRPFYNHFPENNKEEIDLMISMLSMEDQELLKRRYGGNLAKPIVAMEWTRNHQVRLWVLTKRIIPEMIKQYNKNFYEYFSDYTQEEVDEAIKSLPKEMQEKLPIKFDESGLSYYDKSRIYKILLQDVEFIKQQLRKINKRRKIRSIYELLGPFSKEDIDEVILGLKDEEKHLLYLRYGSDLERPITNRGWTQEIHKPLGHLMQKIRYALQTKGKNKHANTIYDYFPDASKERVNALLQMLSIEEKELIYLRYGANLLEPQKTEGWNKELYIKFHSLIKRLQAKNRKTKEIVELLSFEEDPEYQMIIAKHENASKQNEEEINDDDFIMWSIGNLFLNDLDVEIIKRRYVEKLDVETIAKLYNLTPEHVILNLKTSLNAYKRDKLLAMTIKQDNGISRILVSKESPNEE